MSKEEINYWLEVFSKDRFAFMSGDGKKISFYKTFENMKELQQENTRLKEQLNNASNNYTKYIQERDDVINKAIEYINNNYPLRTSFSKNVYDFKIEIKKILEGEK